MAQRLCAIVQSPSILFAAAAVAGIAAGAAAQVQMPQPGIAFGAGTSGVTLNPGTNSSVSGTRTATTFTSHFVGDIVGTINGGQAAGTYSGFTNQGSIVQFNVGALPVQIGTATMNANFKLVASGGNGVAGGNDPLVTLAVHARFYQQLGASPNPNADPFLSAIEFNQNFAQNGNGLQVINATNGPLTSNYILTPGSYYLLQEFELVASYTSNGSVQPQRGFALEFGGGLTGGTYNGFDYSFTWATVPGPGAGALLAVGGMSAARRRRLK
ncbi:hypothetical protein BH11PLA1_BH11PLA1_08260 [soil metagenome]